MSDDKNVPQPVAPERLRAIEALRESKHSATLLKLGVTAEDYANKDVVAMALFGAMNELSDSELADALDAMCDFGMIAVGERGRTAKKLEDYLEGYPFASAVVPRGNEEGCIGSQHFSKATLLVPFVQQMSKDSIRTVLILVERFGWISQ